MHLTTDDMGLVDRLISLAWEIGVKDERIANHLGDLRSRIRKAAEARDNKKPTESQHLPLAEAP